MKGPHFLSMTFVKRVNKLRKIDPVAAKWVEAVAETAETTHADWAVFEAAGNLLAEYERSVQQIQINIKKE